MYRHKLFYELEKKGKYIGNAISAGIELYL